MMYAVVKQGETTGTGKTDQGAKQPLRHNYP